MVADAKHMQRGLLGNLVHSLKSKVVRWALADVPMTDVKFGLNPITMSPGGVDVLRWSGTTATVALGDLGMNITTGRPSAFIGGVDTPLVGSTEVMLLDGSQAMTAAIPLGNQKAVNMADPTDPQDGVNLRYLENVVIPQVSVGGSGAGYIGSASVAEIDALTPAAGDVIVAEDAGTPAAGTSDAIALGDTVEYDGTSWKVIVPNSGGFVPDGTKLIVATSSTFVAGGGLTAATDEGSVKEFDGTTNAPSRTITPTDGSLAGVRGEGSINENKTFTFDGTVPTGVWVQSGGTGSAHGTLTGLTADDHAQYVLLAGRTTGQTVNGGANASGNLIFDSTANATKGEVRFAGGSNTRWLGNDEVTPETDGQGSLGTGARRWAQVRAVFVQTGDLGLARVDDNTGENIEWRIREYPDGLRAINDVTGVEYDIPLRARGAGLPAWKSAVANLLGL